MGSENQDTERASKEATVVVNLKIKPGCEKDYDQWLVRFLILQRKVPGYLGTTTIVETGPDSSERHIIHRFRDRKVMTIIMVIGLTYLAMPLLSRLLRRW